jgi:sRNA-binding carbon storage regulator CsrA
LAVVSLLKELPAPFAVTGLLVGVIHDQLKLSVHAKKEWSAFRKELKQFEAEISGGAGYAKLLEEMVKNEESKRNDPESEQLLKELKYETQKLNDTFATLLNDAKGFFEDRAEIKKVFNAAAHKKAAEHARETLVKYREALDRKTKRYSEIQVAQISAKVSVLMTEDFKRVNHEAFKGIWSRGWGSEVPVADLVSAVAMASTCSPELIERFKARLIKEHPTGKIDIDSVNKMTAGLHPLLNLADTVVAVTPVKISYGRNLEHRAFRELWLFGEDNKIITSSAISVDQFRDLVLAHASVLGQKVELPMARMLRCMNTGAGTISVTDIAVVSVGLDPSLDLLGTIEALATRFEAIAAAPRPVPPVSHYAPVVPPTPDTQLPSAPSTPPPKAGGGAHCPPTGTPPSELRYADLHKSTYVPLPGTPEKGICSRCKDSAKLYVFNGKGTPEKPYNPRKNMIDHVCKC